MQQMLDQLSRDHRKIEKLLDTLEELQTQSAPLSLDDLHSAHNKLQGLQHEQVQGHHELEDQALELLKSRARISDIMISTLERDHARLDSAAVNACTMVKQALKDTATRPPESIRQRILAFTQAYRNHIRTEEDVIFPMIALLIQEQSIASEGNWSAMSA